MCLIGGQPVIEGYTCVIDARYERISEYLRGR